jgi:2-polyprenyl-6-methoxyphenol hydroxylase-like FAD-dependent oxidoreductase
MAQRTYDVIVVGARVAGASTAMLLAQRGLKVLCVDQATFPSDTLSTHQIQLPGVARLKRWGLLDAIIAANTPATREIKLDTGDVVLEGRFPPFDGVDAVYGPRRIVIDKILLDAARANGAEIREDFVVQALSLTDRRVTVQGRMSNGRSVTESALFVIGADGKHSIVAKSVGASIYFAKPILAAAYYAYWDGLHPKRGELYERPRRTIGVWPTDEGLTVTYIGLPIADLADFRSDVAGSMFKAFNLAGDLGERVRAVKQVGRFLGSGYLPNWFRKPYGQGWALVGDAGFVMDPISGQGMSQAFRDADLLADAVEAGLGGRQKLEHALRAYENERNRQGLPMYKLTTQQAAMAPRKRELDILYRSLQGNQLEIDTFLGLLAGSVPMSEYMMPAHLLRVLGVRGIADIIVGKIFPSMGSV